MLACCVGFSVDFAHNSLQIYSCFRIRPDEFDLVQAQLLNTRRMMNLSINRSYCDGLRIVLAITLLLAANSTFGLSPLPRPIIPEYQGEPDLHVAVAVGDAIKVRDLLSLGVLPNQKSSRGFAPIHWLRHGHPRTIDILRFLLRHGGKINERDAASNTALHNAAREWDTELISVLLALGSAVDARNAEGYTPLAISLRNRSNKPRDQLHRTLQTLMAVGADRTDPRLLLESVNRGDTFLVNLFLKLGANPDLGQIVNGHSLLTLAARGKPEMIYLLLKAGLNPNHQSPGFTALSYVLTNGVYPDQYEATKLLLEFGADPNARIYYGSTALMLAAQRSTELVRVLLEKGAYLEIRHPDGKRALEEAINYGQADSIELMIQKGVKLDSTDERGNTSLHYAAYSCISGNRFVSLNACSFVVEQLIRAGASMKIRNGEGKLPVDYVPASAEFAAVRTILLTRASGD